MAQPATLIFRAALEHDKSVWRDIEIEASKSLYQLAETIVFAFGFDFDHAFGFYTGLTPAKMHQRPRYELFADMGGADPDVRGVKKTRVAEAFPAVGRTMVFLFDYGDEWRFRVRLTGTGSKTAKTLYPRILASGGKAPPQYPDSDDEEEEDAPTRSRPSPPS